MHSNLTVSHLKHKKNKIKANGRFTPHPTPQNPDFLPLFARCFARKSGGRSRRTLLLTSTPFFWHKKRYDAL